MTAGREWLDEVIKQMEREGITAPQMDRGRDRIALIWDDCASLALGADGWLACRFRADLEDIRLLLSDDTTEDLSDDELCRSAREELRRVVDPVRRKLILGGFEESFESDREQYVILYKKRFAEATPKEVCEAMKWCRESVGAA